MAKEEKKAYEVRGINMPFRSSLSLLAYFETGSSALTIFEILGASNETLSKEGMELLAPTKAKLTKH